MKRTLLLILTVAVLAAAAFIAGLLLKPDIVQQAWAAVGLQPEALQRLVKLAPAGLADRVDLVIVEQQESSPIVASGTIEAEETALSAEVGGQIVSLPVQAGQTVRQGQVVALLDDSTFQAQLREAEMAVATAEASLEVARSGPRVVLIDMAEADLAQAQASLAGAQQALADAQTARESPLDLDTRIHAAEAQVRLADRELEKAQARQATVAVLRESVAGDGSDQGKTQHAVYQKQEQAAAEQVAAIQQQAAGARRALAQLRQMRANPIELDTQVRAAEGNVQMAESAARVAEAALAVASAGPRAQAVALAEAQLAQAEAARRVLEVQAQRTVITSPLSGTVTARSASAGETAAPGVPLLTVADLSTVMLVIYVPEPKIGVVTLGQEAQVVVDAYPGRQFSGNVIHISPEAEFTPRNIQTVEDRVETVFAVKIRLDNTDGALKPGMPADATLSAP